MRLRSTIILLAGTGLAGCADQSDPTRPGPFASPPGPPATLVIAPSQIGLVVGNHEHLSVFASDATGRNTRVTPVWTSRDPDIASVNSSDGTVTAISEGITTITATVDALRAEAKISVIDVAGTIAFTRMNYLGGHLTSDVLILAVGSGVLQQVTPPDQTSGLAAPTWSPNREQLALEVIHLDEQVPQSEGLDYSSDIYIYRPGGPTGAQWQPVTVNRRSRWPRWSPDGTRIAYVGPDTVPGLQQIYVVNVAGGAPVRLTSAAGWYTTPSWSPDGSRLTFSFWPSGDVGQSDVFIVTADGTGLTNVTRHPAYDGQPSWSPDGKRLAFVSDRNQPDNRTHISDIFVIDVDGSNATSLTSFIGGGLRSVDGPVWSPDGRALAFVLHSPNIAEKIHVLRLGGSLMVGLTTPSQGAADFWPSWIR
ncbi:MAG TPA: Ig-like domain-containing protein [Gemmatimonadaceae bacterium]|nr:Ig-like domain-containing protein [Gemmatimonadaceae bacterium]